MINMNAANTAVNKDLLHNVIDELSPNEFEFVYKLFQSFINDYQDKYLTPDELSAHKQALDDDEWYD